MDKATPAAALSVEVKKLTATGADENAAKARLGDLMSEEKTRAFQLCRRDHENMSDCLAAKFSSSASVLNSLRFEARKSFEQAITSDCATQQGLCLEVLVSEPQCAAKAEEGADPEGGTPAGDAKGKAGAKDAGKEKDKKK